MIDDYYSLTNTQATWTNFFGDIYIQVAFFTGALGFDGLTPAPKFDINKQLEENDINGNMVVKINSFKLARIYSACIEPYIEVEFPNGRTHKSDIFDNIVGCTADNEVLLQKLFMKKKDVKNCVIRIYDNDPKNSKHQLLGSAKIAETLKCFENRNVWAVQGLMNLSIPKELKLVNPKEESTIALMLKFVDEGERIFESEEDSIEMDKEDKNAINKYQNDYMEENVKGRLRLTISHAKD